MNEYYVFGPEYDIVDELYKAIIMLDKERIKELKAGGAALTENVRRVLENGPSRSKGVIHPDYEFRASFAHKIKGIPIEDFEEIAAMLRAEIGKPLHYSEALWLWENKRAFEPRFFEITLDNFNQKQMSKKRLMKQIILENHIGCLPVCEKHGWLKMPKTRDELIQYANENGKTEAAAWLLDFKNRTADLAAEQAKSEKKMLRELNADPNSAAELKKIWSCEKREDGTLRITSYKGKRGEIEVPREIGKSTVTEIGAYAFSAGASRLRTEQRDFRRKELKKVVLPDTVTVIGEGAFNNCWELEQVNIPDGVTEIGAFAFSSCRKITELVIPQSVKAIGENAFSICQRITDIEIPEGVAEIGDCMFSGCYALKSVKLPSTIEKIGIWAFHSCTALEEIIIPKGVTEIGRQAFMDCGSLKTVVIPSSVKQMKNYKYRDNAPETVFHDSANVTVIVEPKSYAEKYCKRYEIKYKYREDI